MTQIGALAGVRRGTGGRIFRRCHFYYDDAPENHADYMLHTGTRPAYGGVRYLHFPVRAKYNGGDNIISDATRHGGEMPPVAALEPRCWWRGLFVISMTQAVRAAIIKAGFHHQCRALF